MRFRFISFDTGREIIGTYAHDALAAWDQYHELHFQHRSLHLANRADFPPIYGVMIEGVDSELGPTWLHEESFRERVGGFAELANAG